MLPVVMFISLAVVALNGRLNALLTNSTLRLFALFYVWIIITFPFSTWRAGSLPVVMYMLRMALICVALSGTLDSIEDCRKAMLAVTFAMVVILYVGVTAMPTDTEEDVRFGLGYGSLANANEFANHMMLGLPICSVLLFKRSRMFVSRIFFGALFLLTVALLAKTGSRGGLTEFVVLGTLVFLTVSFTNKVKLLFAAAILAVVAFSAASKDTLERYATIFSDTGRLEAVQSKAARLDLLMGSLRLTAHHPLVGVGLGNFMYSYNYELEAEGRQHHWEVTHNGYTQVSSELGIPGVILYVSVLFSCIRSLLRVRKQSLRIPELRMVRLLSSVVLLSYISYVISSFFTSNAHEFYFPLLTGLAVAVAAAGRREIDRFSKPRPAFVSQPAFAPAQPMLVGKALHGGGRLQVQQ